MVMTVGIGRNPKGPRAAARITCYRTTTDDFVLLLEGNTLIQLVGYVDHSGLVWLKILGESPRLEDFYNCPSTLAQSAPRLKTKKEKSKCGADWHCRRHFKYDNEYFEIGVG